jgi:hypothetical protein
MSGSYAYGSQECKLMQCPSCYEIFPQDSISQVLRKGLTPSIRASRNLPEQQASQQTTMTVTTELACPSRLTGL